MSFFREGLEIYLSECAVSITDLLRDASHFTREDVPVLAM